MLFYSPVDEYSSRVVCGEWPVLCDFIQRVLRLAYPWMCKQVCGLGFYFMARYDAVFTPARTPNPIELIMTNHALSVYTASFLYSFQKNKASMK